MATVHVDFLPAGLELSPAQQARVRRIIEARQLYRRGFVSYGRDVIHLGAVPLAEAEAWARWALDVGEGQEGTDPPGDDPGGGDPAPEPPGPSGMDLARWLLAAPGREVLLGCFRIVAPLQRCER